MAQRSPQPKNMNQKNIFFIDMETSGLYNPLDKGYPQILSFGACAYDFEQFNVPIIRPNIKDYTIDPEAEAIYGITREKIENCNERKTFKCCWKDFIKWTDKYDNDEIYLVAYNWLKFDFLILTHTLFGSKQKTQKEIFFIDTYFDITQAFPDFQASEDRLISYMQPNIVISSEHTSARDARALKKIFDQLVYMIPFHFIEFKRFYQLQLLKQAIFFRYIFISMTPIYLFDKNCCYEQLPYGKQQVENKKFKITIDRMTCTKCTKSPYERQQILIDQKTKLSMEEVLISLCQSTQQQDQISEDKISEDIISNNVTGEKKVKLEK